ncbi:ABC transporter ATP-binding protein [Paenibacillaceae bacterium WGS1546]|uniref:ABC transporter ATP-binding protein n=1 Tax=Cohnella sp. WGS1546 TaxID=3366810 RepID=UPI00372D2BBA
MHVLELKDVTRTFDEIVAVDRISLTVKEGEIFGFIGPNGAGKSTTIHMIASLLRITQGEIAILGKSVAKHPHFAKAQLGIVPQDLAIYEDLSAYENVAFFAGLYGLRGAELKDRALESLEFVGLADKRGDHPKTFSGGMKRRLNIACAIAHRPKLILMDEPTVGIDPHSRHYILKSIQRLNALGSTIVYSSHYMEEVEEICTRIAIIDHGKIIAEGTKEQLANLVTDRKRTRIGVRSAQGLVIERIREIGGVLEAEADEESVTVSSDVSVNNLNPIIRQLLAMGVEIRSVEEAAPDLENVFLALTGRSLRD